MPAKQRKNETIEDYRERCRLYFINYRDKNREKMRKYNREYNKEWRKAFGYGQQERYEKNYPEKALAHRLLQYAIKHNKIKKLPCERCGNPKSQGHHSDYYKPLEVTWLCPLCHSEEHRKMLSTVQTIYRY